MLLSLPLDLFVEAPSSVRPGARGVRRARCSAVVALRAAVLPIAPSRMSSFTFRDVERLLGLKRPVVQGFVDAGFVAPARGDRNELRFSFQDLILLKTAQGLATVKVPPRRIKQALARLRTELPESAPLSGVRISAVGSRVVVHQGASQWQADSGQYLLDFDVPAAADVEPLPTLTPAPRAGDSADDWFARAVELEALDPAAAEAAYRKAIERQPDFLAAYVNLGCLLQGRGDAAGAEHAYRAATAHHPGEALLHFNLGTALEDQRRAADAAHAYEAAITLDATFADAYFNLARLCETQGMKQEAIRHLGAYRRLMKR